VPPLRPDNWPEGYLLIRDGRVILTFVNRAPFAVGIGLRQGVSGRDFVVSPDGRQLIAVPPGSYEVYYRLHNQPTSLFRAANPLQVEDSTTITFSPGPAGDGGSPADHGLEKLK
jgi:hypothetical protein